MERGYTRANHHDHENGLADLETALRLDPTLTEAYFKRGEVH